MRIMFFLHWFFLLLLGRRVGDVLHQGVGLALDTDRPGRVHDDLLVGGIELDLAHTDVAGGPGGHPDEDGRPAQAGRLERR